MDELVIQRQKSKIGFVFTQIALYVVAAILFYGEHPILGAICVGAGVIHIIVMMRVQKTGPVTITLSVDGDLLRIVESCDPEGGVEVSLPTIDELLVYERTVGGSTMAKAIRAKIDGVETSLVDLDTIYGEISDEDVERVADFIGSHREAEEA